METLKDNKSRLMKTKAALEEENIKLKKIIDRLQFTDNLYVFYINFYIFENKIPNIPKIKF